MELQGERVVLRTLVADDREAIVAIRQTPEVLAWWRREDAGAEFDADLDDDEVEQLAITLDGEVAGMIQFAEETDPDYLHASIDIFVSPDHHRQGIAFDSIVTVVRHLFSQGHHRVTIDPSLRNEAAIACYRKVGFVDVGVMRQYEAEADGTWGDGLLMDLLKSEFRQGA